VVPTGYKPDTPIGVLVGMHGRGADPEGFVSKDGYQKLADALNMAIVGVGAIVPRGKRSFVWSEKPAQDTAHIRSALAELKNKLTPAAGQRGEEMEPTSVPWVEGRWPVRRQSAEVDRLSALPSSPLGDGQVAGQLGEPFDANVQLIRTGLDFIDPERAVRL
jgi:hypothetical protein